MPGANCSIFGCSTSRKSKGIAIFRVPTGDDEYNTNWRGKIVGIVTRDRVIDKSLGNQINNKNIHTCELHYEEYQLLRHEGRTTRIPGSIPCRNLPTKSIPRADPTERSTTSIAKRSLASALNAADTPSTFQIPRIPTPTYRSLEEFNSRIGKLKLPSGWIINTTDKNTKIILNDGQHMIPKFEVIVNAELSFNILVYNWLLGKEEKFLSMCNFSFKNLTLSSLIAAISSKVICQGITLFKNDSLIKHIVPQVFSATSTLPLQQTEFLRPKNCHVLSETSTKCKVCSTKEYHHARKSTEIVLPAKPNAPLSLTSPARIKLALQNYRLENKEMKSKIQKLKAEIERSAVPISKNLNDDLVTIMSNADPSKVTPFMNFFWQEQQKCLNSSSTGVRYHPTIIRYCLSLAAKSSSAYDDLRYDEKTGTGFLILPSRRRLRDYKNYIRPQRGFNKDIINELKLKVDNFSDAERYMILLFDEMKIQENLVWDKHTGELIGYVDLGDPTLNYAALNEVDDIATHVLVFMLRSIINPFKFSLANFGTIGITASQIFPLFWKAVGICELQCGLKVIVATCDGASPNRKFFKMHFHMTPPDLINPNVDVVYRTPNVFSQDHRFIYFISDPPHLIKTARNCLSNSGAGKNTRLMWNNDGFILWNHISQIFYEDRECGLHVLPKLTYEHIHLTPFSVMNVRLAAQVLSSSVANVISAYGPADAGATAKFCSLMDSFFDIANIRDTTEHELKRKPNLAPFTSADDPRLSWLQNVFLQYFVDWQQSIDQRPGNFNKSAKGSMFISWQTYEGLKITVNSIIECIKFLLRNQICGYVLTERFCQDPLENYFGRQRGMGARKDNPSLRDVGFNDNTIRNQKIFRPIAGNVRGADQAVVELTNEPLPCRKKAKTN